jgi:hypothetical protein
MMKSFLAVMCLLCVYALSGCAVIQGQVEDFTESADPEILDGIKSWVEDQGLDAEAAKARAEILARAEGWIVLGVPYGSFDDDRSNDYFDGYRADCSGFVSMAWQIKNVFGAKYSPNTARLGDYATEISFFELLPGDAINNQRGGEHGHVVLFVSWIDDEKTRFVAFEENGGHGKAVQTELTLVEMPGGGYTIKEYDAAAPGPYAAQARRE